MKINEISSLTPNELKMTNEVIRQFEGEEHEGYAIQELNKAIEKVNDEESLARYMKVIHILEELHLGVLTMTNQCYKFHENALAECYIEKNSVIIEMLTNYRNMCHHYREKKKLKTVTNGYHCDLLYSLNKQI